MIIDKYSIDGKKIGEVELADDVFAGEINDILIYEYIKAANANLRQGTHKTKERAEVRGGGAKPWRQKGTGRARQGSVRSPQWKGGGTVFGARPRSYRVELPKKMRQAAYRAILSLKAKEGALKIVEDFTVASGKTRDMSVILKNLELAKGLLVTNADDELTKRSVRNIQDIKFNNMSRISGRDIFYSKNIVLTESAVKFISEKLLKGKK